tara:strand:+ start:864 stop:1730 length:867 start_codon:yes stop_codon:yes gene_type:complete
MKIIIEKKKGKDPKKGSGKKPKGSGRRLYTDEDPSDTVSVKFSTVQDIKDTLSKSSFKSKSHKRQSQIINLIHQRARAAYRNAKDPKVKARLKKSFEYAKKRKEASKRKTQRMKKESISIDEMILEELENVLIEKAFDQILDEKGGKCQKGYKTHPTRKTKQMYGKTYRNCVKAEEKELSDEDILIDEDEMEENLRDWFGKSSGKTKSGRRVGGWVQVGGKYDGAPCAKQPGQKTKPKCVSSAKRRSMSKKERESAARRKRKKDPNPDRRGKPKNVSTDPKTKKKKKS